MTVQSKFQLHTQKLLDLVTVPLTVRYFLFTLPVI